MITGIIQEHARDRMLELSHEEQNKVIGGQSIYNLDDRGLYGYGGPDGFGPSFPGDYGFGYGFDPYYRGSYGYHLDGYGFPSPTANPRGYY